MNRDADANQVGEGGGGKVRTLDAREVDGAPFDAITSALADLDAGETLVLVNSFEPEPLYDVLERRGFSYDAEQAGDDEWRVTIERE